MTDVLVVDDDRDLVDALRYILHREGYRVVPAYESEAAMRLFQALVPILVILDVKVPGLGGFDLCRRLRTLSSVPIIMLTAGNYENDLVNALEIGADDCLAKPFSLRQLLARMRFLLRRSMPSDSPNPSNHHLSSGDCKLDLNLRVATCRGRSIHLTEIEAKILHFLMTSEGRVISAPMIVERVWGSATEDNRDLVKVHVCRLRAKVEDDRCNPRLIQTVVDQAIGGLGYCFHNHS